MVAAAPYHHLSALIKIGRPQTWALPYHWPGWLLSYRLGFRSSIKIHPVFHVSLLEPHVANTFFGRVVDIPPPIEVDGIPEFVVQAVLDSRIRRRTLQYFVDWVGYDESDRSWERAGALHNATKAVDAFHKIFPAKPR